MRVAIWKNIGVFISRRGNELITTRGETFWARLLRSINQLSGSIGTPIWRYHLLLIRSQKMRYFKFSQNNSHFFLTPAFPLSCNWLSKDLIKRVNFLNSFPGELFNFPKASKNRWTFFHKFSSGLFRCEFECFFHVFSTFRVFRVADTEVFQFNLNVYR